MLNFSCFRALLALLAAAPLAALAQTPGVGIGTTTPAASALLDVSSTTKGLLPPRMSTAQRDAIASPAAGLIIFNTSTSKLNTWNGTSWNAALSTTEQPTAVVAGTAVTFSYTGSPQTYTVPAGIRSLRVDAAGAGGGPGNYEANSGGAGAQVQATLAVTPGEVLTLYVGGSSGGQAGGYNGGGSGSAGRSIFVGGGGGGASDVRRSATAPSTSLAERLLVAGGGGGGAYGSGGGLGGAPDGTTGRIVSGGGGQGATQTAGGNLGGQLGRGGDGSGEGGGGGGGYYGGGGADYIGGGGGGSSWVTPAGSSGVAMTAGTGAGSSGNGSLVLTPVLLTYTAPALDGRNFVNVAGPWTEAGGNVYRSTGNVGIGTSTPTQKLEVAGQVFSSSGGFRFPDGSVQATAATGGGSAIINQTTVQPGANFNIGGNGYVAGNVGIGTPSPTAARLAVRSDNNASVPIATFQPLNETQGVSLTFNGITKTGTNTTSDLTLDGKGTGNILLHTGSTGSVGIGTTIPGAKLDVAGSVRCVGLTQTSDRRFKANVRPLGSALAAVLALRGVRYEWNALGIKHGGTAGAGQVGLIAQEVEKIYPELVSTDAEGFKAVNYAQLTPVLIEALKEQQQQIEALKAQLAGQAGDHAALETLKARAATAETQATATMQAFEARLRQLEAPGAGQARR